LVASCLPGAAWASETDVLLNKLVEKGILTVSDAQEIRKEMNSPQQSENDKGFEKKISEVAKKALPDSSSNWKWGGDIRLRNEYRNRTGSGADVNRQRIRFRYGFEGKVTDQLKASARLVTGSISATTGNPNDPVSTNQSFNTSFNKKPFLLDQAYVEYAPELPGLNEAKLTGGMIPNPFWTVGPLVWDDDLAFDGAAIHLAKHIGPASLFLNSGLFSLQTDISEAASLWSIQSGGSIQPFKGDSREALGQLKFTAALAYYDYKNVTNPLSESTAITMAGGYKGNTSGIRDLNLLNPSLELATQFNGVPAGLFTDWVHNTSSRDNNGGFQLGLRAGKAKTPFSLKDGWEAGYYFERVEPDATFGAFTDSDFGGGGTNHLGNVWWVRLAVLKNSMVGLKYSSAKEVTGTKNHEDRFQTDWITKF